MLLAAAPANRGWSLRNKGHALPRTLTPQTLLITNTAISAPEATCRKMCDHAGIAMLN